MSPRPPKPSVSREVPPPPLDSFAPTPNIMDSKGLYCHMHAINQNICTPDRICSSCIFHRNQFATTGNVKKCTFFWLIDKVPYKIHSPHQIHTYPSEKYPIFFSRWMYIKHIKLSLILYFPSLITCYCYCQIDKNLVWFYLGFNKIHARYAQKIGLEAILGIRDKYAKLLVFIF